MNIDSLFAAIGMAWILLCLLSIITRWIKGFWKLGFKEALVSTLTIGVITWTMLGIIFFILSIPAVVDWVAGEQASVIGTLHPYLIFFYIFTGLTVFILVFGKVISYKPQYSEREQEFLKEENLKWKKKLGWFGRFVKVG